MTTSFVNALRCWEPAKKGFPDPGISFPDWFATENALPSKHFLETARTLLSESDRHKSEFLRLKRFLKELNDKARIKELRFVLRRRYWINSKSPAGRILPRMSAQLRALVHGVLSAYYFRRWEFAKGEPPLTDEMSTVFARHAIDCIDAYRKAVGHKTREWRGELYPITNLDTKQDRSRPNEKNNPWGLLAACVESDPNLALNTSAVLMWRRLISYLLDETQAPLVEPESADGSFAKPVEFQSEGRALWAVQDSDDEGAVSPVVVQFRSEGPEAFYWDPVALGMLVLDRPLLDSVQQAWDLIRNETAWKEKETARTLRITLVRTESIQDVPKLGGASAGALVGCTMYAAVHRMVLNKDASITARVLNNRGELGFIHGLVSKLKAAENARSPLIPITTLVVSTDQQKIVEERKRFDSIQQLAREDYKVTLYEESFIADAIVHLLGDHRCETVLRNYAAKKLDEWNLLRTNASDDERLDHFVEQRYSRLAAGVTPFQRIEAQARRQQSPDGDDLSESRFQYHDVGGEGDVALANLLKDTPWLLLCEDAGAGKTVFTRRALAWLSLPSAWEVLSRGRPLLAIRWEKTWPTLDHERSIKNFDNKVAAAIAEVLGGTDDECLAIAKYARTHHRLCLILDAMDQADVEQVSNLAKFTEEMARRAASDPEALAGVEMNHAGGPVPVRLIVTTRVYKIQEFPPFKDGSRWRFGKVELFNEDQRRRYLADLSEEKRQALIPDESLFAPTDANEPHLFAFPEVLRLIRSLIEKSSATGEELTPIRNRADLYDRVSNMLVQRALERLPVDLQQRHRLNDEQKERLREMLAALAFTLQLAGCYQGEVPVGQTFVKEIKRCAMSICSEETRRQWYHDYELMERTEFTDRCGISGDGQQALGFRTRKTMEFHAAVHLALYANDPTAAAPTTDFLRAWRNERKFENLITPVAEVVRLPKPSTGTASTSHRFGNSPIVLETDDSNTTRSANNSDRWKEVWRLALELAENEPTDQVRPTVAKLCGSLEVLFERPAAGRRPCELMYRAWVLFKRHPSLKKAGAAIIARFQQEAVEMLRDDNLWREKIPRGEPGEPMEYVPWTVAQLIATLIPEYRVQELIAGGHISAERWKQIAPPGWGWFLPPHINPKRQRGQASTSPTAGQRKQAQTKPATAVLSTDSGQSSTTGVVTGASLALRVGMSLHDMALAQLEAWRAAGFCQEWDEPEGSRNVFRYEDRSFVPGPPVEFAELLKQSLFEEGIWTKEEIATRVAAIDHDTELGQTSYLRGSHADDDEGYDDERPQHWVRLTQTFWMQTFWMQTTAVTRSQFALFDPAIGNRSLEYMPDPDCPALNVSWWDSVLFGLFVQGVVPGFGQPTEAQWECAARAGRDFAGPRLTPTPTAWARPRDVADEDRVATESSDVSAHADGVAVKQSTPRFERFGIPPFDTLSPDQANFGGNLSRTLPVRWNKPRYELAMRSNADAQPAQPFAKEFPTNLWGIWQAHGNAWEWCRDEYDGDEYQKHDGREAIDPARETDSPTVTRVLRGGSWINPSFDSRSAVRSRNAPVNRDYYVACRSCVCVVGVRTKYLLNPLTTLPLSREAAEMGGAGGR